MQVVRKLSLVIPCYNEAETLEAVLGEVLKISSDDLSLELIVVDDCSSDGSAERAEGMAAKHPEIRVLRHSANRGKGAALRTGFAAATGDFVGVQDADMEYDPRDYIKCCVWRMVLRQMSFLVRDICETRSVWCLGSGIRV